MIPDLKATLGDVLGWSRAGQLPHGLKLSTEAQQRFDADAKRMAAFAATADGQWLIELLLDVTIRKAPIDLSLTGEDARAYATQRHGQNQIAALIVTYLNRNEELEDEARNPGRNRGDGGPDGRDDPDGEGGPPLPPWTGGTPGPGPGPGPGTGADAGASAGFDPAGTIAVG